jgi:nicotinate-nucleotide adenylyltransferase
MHPTQQGIGILGGTFDPIHHGHLRSALEIQQALNLAEVRLIPCFQPTHRPPPLASPEDRLAMIQSAIIDEPMLTVDDCEIQRKGPSYLIDTLIHLRKHNPNTPLCFIMGIDSLVGLPSWHRYEEIIELAHLVVIHRPRYTMPETGIISTLIKQRLQHNPEAVQKTLSGIMLLLSVTQLEISATEIRKQIAAGENPRYLLPNSVYKYIKEHGIYRMSHI